MIRLVLDPSWAIGAHLTITWPGKKKMPCDEFPAAAHLVCDEDQQLTAEALEAARIAVNKHLGVTWGTWPVGTNGCPWLYRTPPSMDTKETLHWMDQCFSQTHCYIDVIPGAMGLDGFSMLYCMAWFAHVWTSYSQPSLHLRLISLASSEVHGDQRGKGFFPYSYPTSPFQRATHQQDLVPGAEVEPKFGGSSRGYVRSMHQSQLHAGSLLFWFIQWVRGQLFGWRGEWTRIWYCRYDVTICYVYPQQDHRHLHFHSHPLG